MKMIVGAKVPDNARQSKERVPTLSQEKRLSLVRSCHLGVGLPGQARL